MSTKKKLSKSVHNKMEYLEYEDQLKPNEKEFIEKFYDEYYNDGVSFTEEDDMVLSGKEMIQEARKNHNSLKRDAFDVARKLHKLDHDNEKVTKFLEDASDDFEWMDAFEIGGFELACTIIFGQALRDLDNKLVDRRVTLSRFYIKMEALRKELNKTQFKERKDKK